MTFVINSVVFIIVVWNCKEHGNAPGGAKGMVKETKLHLCPFYEFCTLTLFLK